MRDERRRRAWKRLRRRRLFTGDVALRNRTLVDRKHRLARLAIERVDEAALVARDHRGNPAAAPRDGREERRRRAVVVPEIVMDELKSPRELAALRAQPDDRVRPPAVAAPTAAVVA